MVQKTLDLNKPINMEEEEIYHLSPEELEAVEEGLWQIETGLFFSNEEANRRVEKFSGNTILNCTMNRK